MAVLSEARSYAISITPQKGLLVLFLTLIFYFLLVSVYRLTLHPLARYPGPFWNKISGWPLIIACYSGDRHLREYRNHQKYAAALHIHGKSANVKKSSWYETLDIGAGAPSVQMVRDKTEHARRRRLASPAFSIQALKDAEQFITQDAVKLCDQLDQAKGDGEEWTPNIKFSDWASYYGFDFISHLAFGMSFNMLEDTNTRYIPVVAKNASQFLYYLGYLPFVALIRPFLGTCVFDYIGGHLAKDSLRYVRLANQRLEDRIQAERHRQQEEMEEDKAVRKDIFHYLLHVNPTNDTTTATTSRPFTKEELQADSALFIAAGSDAVGLTITALLFYLLTNPSAHARLASEIRTAFTSDGEIANPKLNSLPYLHACVKETLRICPPAPSTLPREVLSGGLVVDGYFVPKGAIVGIAIYVMQHDPRFFPDPWSFRPERWILLEGDDDADEKKKEERIGGDLRDMKEDDDNDNDDDDDDDDGEGKEQEQDKKEKKIKKKLDVTKESLAQARSALIPFLIGPMNCLGKNIAYVAVKQAIAHLLYRFDVRVPPEGGGGGSKCSGGTTPTPTGGGRSDLPEGRQRPGEYQITDYVLGFRDGPIVQLKRREGRGE